MSISSIFDIKLVFAFNIELNETRWGVIHVS